GQIGVRGCVEDRSPALFQDHVVALVLADLVDDARELLEHALEQGLLLLLELLLEVVHHPRGVAALALERLLLVTPDVGRQQGTLLLQLVAEILELLALAVHLLLHHRLLSLLLPAALYPRPAPSVPRLLS